MSPCQEFRFRFDLISGLSAAQVSIDAADMVDSSACYRVLVVLSARNLIDDSISIPLLVHRFAGTFSESRQGVADVSDLP